MVYTPIFIIGETPSIFVSGESRIAARFCKKKQYEFLDEYENSFFYTPTNF